MNAYLREALRPAQLSISFLAISIGITVLQVRPWAITTAKRSAAVVDMAGRAMTNLDSASKSLKKASEDESEYLNNALPQLTQRINGVIDNANGLVSDVRSATRSANSLVNDLRGTAGKLDNVADSANQVLISAKADTDAARPVVNDIDAFIKSPDLTETMKHVNGVSSHMDGITGDAQIKFHYLLYPESCKGKWCWAKKSWEAIEAGHDAPEMVYWLQQIFKH
jgi:uncharacterized protein YoxC